MIETKNQLFIHTTDQCNLQCAFCVYAKSRIDNAECAHIDMKMGFARQSMKNLIQGAQHTAFSGGGEPFLNTDAIIDCIRLNRNKKYMITTGIGISLAEMESKIEMINTACMENDSLCVLRISVDSFHGNMSFGRDFDTIMKWFINKRWKNVRTCFIRGTVSEGEILLKELKKYCRRHFLPYIYKKINKYTYAMIIRGKFFQVILRPTIYPNPEELIKEEKMLIYIDNMLQIDTEEIILGKPRSCRGCKGCDSWKSGLLNGLDVTVNARGDIYLYGAEICSLGNIYDEVITYDLLNSRVDNCTSLVKMQKYGVREIMEALLEDPILGNIADSINYPFAVIRECMKEHKEDVLRVIADLPDR